MGCTLAVQFYARGAFASPAIGWCSSGNENLLGNLQRGVWAISAVLHSTLDWPVRRLSGGKLTMLSRPRACKPTTFVIPFENIIFQN